MIGGRTEALSALDWWREAGVDALVEEDPRDWLAAPAKPRPAVPAAPTAGDLPATLADFRLWLRDNPALPGAPGARILPAGDPASGLMLLADMPEAPDASGELLFSGEVGRLFDRMLAAIGRDRASVYLAPMAGVRVPIRELDSAETSRVVRHHVGLAAPRLVLLLGNAPSRALLGMDFANARGRIHDVNHDGAIVPAIATFHPRLLLQQPARKADAWADLRMALEVLSV